MPAPLPAHPFWAGLSLKFSESGPSQRSLDLWTWGNSPESTSQSAQRQICSPDFCQSELVPGHRCSCSSQRVRLGWHSGSSFVLLCATLRKNKHIDAWVSETRCPTKKTYICMPEKCICTRLGGNMFLCLTRTQQLYIYIHMWLKQLQIQGVELRTSKR